MQQEILLGMKLNRLWAENDHETVEKIKEDYVKAK